MNATASMRRRAVPCSDVFVDAVHLFGSQKNTSLSFADAAIAVIARTRADGQVLTFDAGFRKMKGLRPEPAKRTRRRNRNAMNST
jgi:predicted nucleic acid-binding protein